MSAAPGEQSPDPQDAGPAVGSRIYVGTYTGELGSGRGLEGFRLTGADADRVAVQQLTAVELSSPGYLLAHPTLPVLYAVAETSPTLLYRLGYGDDGSPVWQETLELSGAGGCHLAWDETGRYLLVAHYGGGSVSAVAVSDDGSLGDETGHRQFTGTGPVADRQEASHAHQAVCHDNVVYVPDLGADLVHQLRLTPEGALDLADDALALPAGSGPRHLVVDGDVMVIACELSAELVLARRHAQTWTVGAAVRTTSAEGECYPSALIRHDRGYLVANRGPDTVASFALDDAGDTLTPGPEFATQGAWPRDLVLAADRLWVANQHSDHVAVFAESTDRTWRLDMELPCPSPACIVVLP